VKYRYTLFNLMNLMGKQMLKTRNTSFLMFAFIATKSFTVEASHHQDVDHFHHHDSSDHSQSISAIPHFDLEMDSSELLNHLRLRQSQFPYETLFDFENPSLSSVEKDTLEQMQRMGARLHSWIDTVNAHRSEDEKLKLSSPTSRAGIPIDTPLRYSPSIIIEQFENFKNQSPQSILSPLDSGELSPTLPLTDDEFVKYGKMLDAAYTLMLRWKTLTPHRSHYIKRQKQDVRGYYFLQQNGWTEEKLTNFHNLNQTIQNQLKEHLVGICINTLNSSVRCSNLLKDAIRLKSVDRFYSKYIHNSRKTYNDFFTLKNPRRDILWSLKDSSKALIPFLDPKDDKIKNFLQSNIENEFKWLGWQLTLNFINRSNIPFIVFVPGATPNVNGIGGNRITLNKDVSIDEYSVQWTIRHEFGHVLGLPDCYHEFFDADNNQFVNYQLDTSNLMCSRAGDFNEHLYKELKRYYLK